MVRKNHKIQGILLLFNKKLVILTTDDSIYRNCTPSDSLLNFKPNISALIHLRQRRHRTYLQDKYVFLVCVGRLKRLFLLGK